MTEYDLLKLEDYQNQLMEALDFKLRVSNSHVSEIVVSSLIGKYKSAVRRAVKDADSIKKVLLTWYITDEEFKQIMEFKGGNNEEGDQ